MDQILEKQQKPVKVAGSNSGSGLFVIGLGKGTDSAIETADIVLMQDHLGKLPSAIHIARLVNRIIQFNISVAMGLKLLALLLTIPGWLTLWVAILSDMGATVIVSLISLTILIQKKPK